jgi:hypothetical protein
MDAARAARNALTLTVDDVLAVRLFPKRIGMPDRWAQYYWRLTPIRRIPNGRRHTLRYAA